jgi:hypothetical protein
MMNAMEKFEGKKYLSSGSAGPSQPQYNLADGPGEEDHGHAAIEVWRDPKGNKGKGHDGDKGHKGGKGLKGKGHDDGKGYKGKGHDDGKGNKGKAKGHDDDKGKGKGHDGGKGKAKKWDDGTGILDNEMNESFK